MNIFKQSKKEQQDFRKKTLSGFKEAVKELDELYDDARADYEAIEKIVEQFDEFVKDLDGRLQGNDKEAMDQFAAEFSKINTFARNNLRDIRDVLRNQKKRLKELQNDI